MKLRFLAKPGRCVHWPGLKATGQAYAYFCRDFVAGDPEKGTAAEHPAKAEAVEIDSDTVEGRRFAKVCRRDGDLWPADKATAEFCGREFVDVERDADGEWQPKRQVKTKAAVKDAG